MLQTMLGESSSSSQAHFLTHPYYHSGSCTFSSPFSCSCINFTIEGWDTFFEDGIQTSVVTQSVHVV